MSIDRLWCQQDWVLTFYWNSSCHKMVYPNLKNGQPEVCMNYQLYKYHACIHCHTLKLQFYLLGQQFFYENLIWVYTLQTWTEEKNDDHWCVLIVASFDKLHINFLYISVTSIGDNIYTHTDNSLSLAGTGSKCYHILCLTSKHLWGYIIPIVSKSDGRKFVFNKISGAAVLFPSYVGSGISISNGDITLFFF
jgi:hypothetical protein